MSLQFQHLQCSVIIYTGRKFQKIHRYNFFLFASTVYVFLVDEFFFHLYARHFFDFWLITNRQNTQ